MDDKLKILLGSEDIVARNNEDLFININLNRSFYEYKKEKYDNDFDLAQQFDKERNLSRNFRVYGIIDSNVVDTNSMFIKAYSDSGATNLVFQTYTTSMNFNNSINVFNKKVGKYYIPLENYSGSSIFIKTPSNNDNLASQIFEEKLVFYDSDSVFIPYGTETVEIDDNLVTIDINNNFPFFYNKHWVKKNISLQQTKYPVVNFSGSSQTISEGEVAKVIVYLDKPSPFGNEKVDFVFDSGTADTFDFLVYSGSTSNSFPGTVQLSFSQGEQYKSIFFSASTDNVVELLENYKFRLDNFVKVKSGSSLQYSIQIENITPRTFATYELSGLYENRLPHVGFSAITTAPYSLFSTPSILRNGLFYSGLQDEFYPIDEINVDIKNSSFGTTLLPQNSGLGNIDDEIWLAGEVKTFTIKPQYSTSILNEVSIYLPPSLNGVSTGLTSAIAIQLSVESVLENISINGFKMQYNTGVYPFVTSIPNGESASYEALKKMLDGGIFDVYNIEELYKPFTVTTNDSSYTIKLTAKSPGVRLDVDTNVKRITNLNLIATGTTITPFSYPTQDPFRLTLLGNENNGQVANYQFRFYKKGYRDLNITNSAVASTIGQFNYLTTSLKNVLHNWNAPYNTPIAFSGNPIQANFLPNTYFLPKSEAFYPGLLMLNGSDVNNPNASNLTSYGANAFTVSTSPLIVDAGRWYQTPLITIPRVTTSVSSENISQVTSVKITTVNTNPNFYSFKYRSGTDSYKTFYWTGNKNANILANTGSGLKVSGTTMTPRNSPGLKYELDLGTTYAGQVIPPGPVKVYSPGYQTYEITSNKFYSPYYPTSVSNNNITYQGNGALEMTLSAKTAGVPFDIRDIVNNNSSSKIFIMPVFHNEIAGVTQNPYNNKMGGFSLIAP